MGDFWIEDAQTALFIGDSITDCGRRGAEAPLGSGYVRFFTELATARFAGHASESSATSVQESDRRRTIANSPARRSPKSRNAIRRDVISSYSTTPDSTRRTLPRPRLMGPS